MSHCRSAIAVAVMAVLTCITAAASEQMPANEPESRDAGRARLLDVPYLSQTEDLCGGAAAAMVLRYWGERQIYPEDFSALVDRSASGIRTDVLAADVSRRGWRAFPIDATAGADGAWVRQHLERGRPIVALIEVRPNRYHYVVVVAWTAGHVIAHDSAQAPFRVFDEAAFEEAWTAAGRWALLVLPGELRRDDDTRRDGPASPSTTATAPPQGDHCGSLVQNLVPLARNGAIAEAEAGLTVAATLCADDPAVWRALAGVRFLQSRWRESGAFAERAARLDPGDVPGWDLLATSRFLDDAPEGALEAWNRIGRPLVDIVRVEGARRTGHPLVVDLVGLQPRTLLTPERHDHAARRLDELPSASLTRLRYQPIDGGFAEISAVIVERPTLPRGLAPLAIAATRALIQREAALDVASPSGSGELWTAAWRWWERRPRVAFGLAIPSSTWLPGIVSVEGSWERSTYAPPGPEGVAPGTRSTLERRRAAFGVTDWATSRVRWKTGAALDRWNADSHFSLDGGIDLRVARDHVALAIDGAGWMPMGSGRRFASGALSLSWRSAIDARVSSWTLLGGVTAVSTSAPLDVWPGAGTGLARLPLLRAHPLLEDGIVNGAAFGRRLSHATLEYQHPLWLTEWAVVRFAAFSDVARAWQRIGGVSGSAHVDVGVGLRVALPGKGGALRADIARGVRDGGTVLSAGWVRGWPRP